MTLGSTVPSTPKKMTEKKNASLVQSVSLLIVAIGLMVGAWEYWDSNSQNYRKEIWSAQKLLYERAIEAASKIANGRSLASVSESRKEFWGLYWGSLAMLESPRVESAMVQFGEILAECEKTNENSCFQPVPGNLATHLQGAALNIAHCARKSLRETWEPVDIGKLPGVCREPKPEKSDVDGREQ